MGTGSSLTVCPTEATKCAPPPPALAILAMRSLRAAPDSSLSDTRELPSDEGGGSSLVVGTAAGTAVGGAGGRGGAASLSVLDFFLCFTRSTETNRRDSVDDGGVTITKRVALSGMPTIALASP